MTQSHDPVTWPSHMTPHDPSYNSATTIQARIISVTVMIWIPPMSILVCWPIRISCQFHNWIMVIPPDDIAGSNMSLDHWFARARADSILLKALNMILNSKSLLTLRKVSLPELYGRFSQSGRRMKPRKAIRFPCSRWKYRIRWRHLWW